VTALGDSAQPHFRDDMVLRKYISTISLCFVLIGLIRQSYRDAVHSGLWITLAIFVGFALFVKILVENGIMQITPVNQMPRTKHIQSTNNYRNYHYNSIVAKINSSGVTVTTVDEAIKTYSSLFNVGEKAAKPFFHNPFVMSTLSLSNQGLYSPSQDTDQSKHKSNKLDPTFWDNVSKGVAKNEGNTDESCADLNCSKPVSAFDFRCFKCRKRFCGDCESGKRIMCKACS